MTKNRPLWAVRLRQQRESRLLSQRDLAQLLRKAAGAKVGLPEPASLVRNIRVWESGEYKPNALYQTLLRRALKLPEAWLSEETPSGSSQEAPCPALPDTKAGAHPLPQDRLPVADETIRLTAWIESTNVGGSTIAMLAETTHRLAEHHTLTPPASLLPEVIGLHRQTQALLQGGKQRLRQTRELFRIEADLLAHATILLGDLHDDEAAITHGVTAALCAEEAGASQAAALSAQAKTQRWRRRYEASADLARRGYECSPSTPMRVLLASQEANAAGLLGDFDRARQALRRAEEASEAVADDSGVSPWSCPRSRQALYALSVSLQAGDLRSALEAADAADAAWSAGAPWVYGTWAQVRFGAGIAYVMMGDLHGAADQIAPVMTLPPPLRLATITNYLVNMDMRLNNPRFRGSEMLSHLREQIQTFNSAALPAAAAKS